MTTATLERRGLCFDCNYALEGLDSTRCPECGRPFRPNDCNSMNMVGPIGPISRAALRPTPWIAPAATIVAVGTLLICNWTLPDVRVSLLVLWLAIGIVVLASIPKMALRARTIRRYGLPPDYKTIDNAVARKVHKTLWIVSVAMLLRLPLMLVFFLSVPSLSRVATHEYAEVPFDSPRPQNTRIGLFLVRSVSAGAYGVSFDLPAGISLEYLPNPDRDSGYFLRRKIFGDWYVRD